MIGLSVVTNSNYYYSMNGEQASEYLAIMQSFTNSFLFLGHF
jgi:hypothetical protein